ncbi:plasmid pRiA4b ORF-3 family protein [Sphaerisporangium perillae]|uniref:plasmid pRiA4b ORF-3 family protein n=1 Tax=Sphaerisporangium perillae TaxID=2935860 RepID=UPI00200FBBF6|nr:plasmid pRiA4b ORF-3 family protein [Sphaerisporangium perillae]
MTPIFLANRTKGRAVVGSVHQVTLRDVHPPVWRRIHVPSTANRWNLHNVIQFAMGWQNYHLHLFAHEWEEYGDNARDETAVTLAGLLPRPGGRLAYRYDFGDCWDHDIEVEKIHQAAKNSIYPRCPAGGRACPPEDSGGPEGFATGSTPRRARCSDRASGTAPRGTRAEVNAELAALAERWAQRDTDQASKAAAARDGCASRRPLTGRLGEPEHQPHGIGAAPVGVQRQAHLGAAAAEPVGGRRSIRVHDGDVAVAGRAVPIPGGSVLALARMDCSISSCR